MKKIFVLKGLDCPHCSAKIEAAVGAMNGINMSSVNLMNQTLTVEAASYNGDLFKDIEKIVHGYEPDVDVFEKTAGKEKIEEEDSNKKEIIKLSIGAAIYVIGLLTSHFGNFPIQVNLGILIISYLILGGEVILKAVSNITKGRVFDENFLMVVSTVGAFAIGSYSEAVAVMLFYDIGEFFQDLAVYRSRKYISYLMDICPDSATVKRGSKTETVSPENVAVGETILVKPGEKIPLDGRIIEGKSMLDTRALTGESVPRAVGEGDNAVSGCINQNGVLTIEVTKSYGESTVSKIIDLVENAASKKAPTENFITTFSRFYTPIVVIMALLLAVIPPIFAGGWAEWIRRGCVFLVISCPCALVISVPLTFFGGIGSASRKGVLVKGGNYLEALNKLDTIVFDKTGTLTKGVFKVTEIIASDGFSNDEILEYAAKAESFSNHPIARSIIDAYGKDIDSSALSDYTEISGQGIRVNDGVNEIVVGNEKAIGDIEFKSVDKIGTKVYVAVDGKCAGCILISDEIKQYSRKAISELKKLGIRKTVMLTGDDKRIARAVSEEMGIDDYYADLQPNQKVENLEKLDAEKNGKIAFVGDGINDAPVLARADVGIAMGGLGSDAAIEAADVVLMNDAPMGLVDAVKTANATKRIVMQNIIFALSVKAVFLILGAFGIAGMWEVVFGDVGVMLIAVINAMRILKK
ncbi:MAG: cadmium-translocating P-type ATPase [Oscillospiraceae bacterium]|nr:cadmium-translocating P-type ATPase [Oscillospiraceae bacterium]